MLRDYQQRAIDELYSWFSNNQNGNPCLNLPTGAGKSHIVAALCKDAVQNWPETKILMLTHSKELIEQNAEKMRQHWRNAPLGIYSASIGLKQLGHAITFAGIQSLRNKADDIGHIDLMIIDECHVVSHKDEGGYRTLIADLKVKNPHMRVIGLTATPYRLGHGLITDKPAIFDDIIEPVKIEELVFRGYLSPLRSKVTDLTIDTKGVKKRGGEFVESDLQRMVNTDENNISAVEQTIRLAGDRKSWLFFCTGVEHAHSVAGILRERGIIAECVTGDTPKKERERILTDFKGGKIKALTNANVLTTGFDAPNIDLIAMMRPTMSPALYVQMAGRGLRIADGKTDCLVLDFAGVVREHGPITAVEPPKKAGDGTGEAPVKVCDSCGELVHTSTMVCPACGEQFPEPEKNALHLHDDDIMYGTRSNEMHVKRWKWQKHISSTSGKEMLKVSYYGDLSDPRIDEYFCIKHGGYTEQRAMRDLAEIAIKSGADIYQSEIDIAGIADAMNKSIPPVFLMYEKDGKFQKVIFKQWAESNE